MDTDTQAKLTMILILLAIIFILKVVNATSWNGGYCSCGGAWRYQQAIGHRFETTFLYQCDKCGKTKEFYQKYTEIGEIK